MALENENSVGHIFNVCTGRSTEINELVQIVSEVTGRTLRIVYDKPRKGDIRHNYGDPTKAKEVLGFEARISLKNGLKSYLKSLS